MEKREVDRKQSRRIGQDPDRAPIVMKPTRPDLAPMAAPVPWSLAWSDDGELAPQDRFDLLQTLVISGSETSQVQTTLIAAIERLPLEQLTCLPSDSVTGLCA